MFDEANEWSPFTTTGRADSAKNADASDRLEITPFMRIAFGMGGAATSIVVSGVSMFIILYHSLVLGVPAGLVGTTLAVALIFGGIPELTRDDDERSPGRSGSRPATHHRPLDLLPDCLALSFENPNRPSGARIKSRRARSALGSSKYGGAGNRSEN